ncbi:SDR family oxidoreductase [Massilia sp. CCM 8734]|uniref:SDR family NAD(P)-dependent oxidoreductase n=1 Tax=Massilia sp. CCM 8734 TaxID=2609283 RepID=UPI00142308BF|nr:SDR family oxidoreductase [Massilia sp. CCM 8734]NHZ99501.1 SDR family oxidoreductase [Massilia sp. CCM 8734]
MAAPFPHAAQRQVAVVTGAAAGIGAATAAALARDGYDVACLDRDEVPLAGPDTGAGGARRAFRLDVCDEDAVAHVFADIMAWRGRIDALATCAGIVDTSALAELDAARFMQVVGVNLLGSFLPIKAAAAHMRTGGRICTVSSVAGLRGGGLAGTIAYAASKGGVIAMSKTMARELGPRGITVNCIAPAVIRTPMLDRTTAAPGHIERLHGMTALRREGTAAEAAEAIVWYLSEKSSFVSGTTMAVDGGLSMA